MTTTARICLDMLTAARARREEYVGADRAARFLVGATRKGWRKDFASRFAPINGLPGVILYGPEGTMQTTAFEIEGGRIRALYVVRNPDKLRHLAAGSAPSPEGTSSGKLLANLECL